MEGDIVSKKDPGPRIKDRDLYERLRGAGVSRKIATRVANSTARVAHGTVRVADSAARVSRKKAAKHGGGARSYDDWKVPDLRRRAKQVGITGRSAMTKKQLIKALRAS
jgi:Rho termination factor, N-terminal domain